MTDDADRDDCEGCVSDPNEKTSLPEVPTSHATDEIRARLRSLSKKGKLPGYEPDEPGAICSVAAHGVPFDSKLILRSGEGSVVFETRLLPTMPWVFAIVLIIAIWPGLPLTDSFLSSFDWYMSIMGSIGIDTWHWYLPLTVLPAPFAMRSAIRKSRSSARESALEQIEKIRSVL